MPNRAQTLAYFQRRYCYKLLYNHREIPPIIFDFGAFKNWKNELMLNELVSQIFEVIELNIRAEYPFKLCFFNYDKNSVFHECMKKHYGDDVLAKNIIFENEKSFFKIFPLEKLVYLRRDFSNGTFKYDPTKVYIIVSLVDDGSNACNYVSQYRARKFGIETQKIEFFK